jgi:hypothetical protein
MFNYGTPFNTEQLLTISQAAGFGALGRKAKDTGPMLKTYSYKCFIELDAYVKTR